MTGDEKEIVYINLECKRWRGKRNEPLLTRPKACLHPKKTEKQTIDSIKYSYQLYQLKDQTDAPPLELQRLFVSLLLALNRQELKACETCKYEATRNMQYF